MKDGHNEFTDISFVSFPHDKFSIVVFPVSRGATFPCLHLKSSQTGQLWNGHLDGLQDSSLLKCRRSKDVIEVLQEWLNLAKDNKNCTSKRRYQVDLKQSTEKLMHLLIAVKCESTRIVRGCVWQLRPVVSRPNKSLHAMMEHLSKAVISRHGEHVLISLETISLRPRQFAVWKTLVNSEYFELVDGSEAIKVLMEGQYQATLIRRSTLNVPKVERKFTLAVGSCLVPAYEITICGREASTTQAISRNSELRLIASEKPDGGTYNLVIKKI
ncbi:hypothetical protein AeRB84_017557 [Aphanomyces euteiches]|nr:hypothetical protein AeRB84_017557 [Aphanomyces euteiches]